MINLDDIKPDTMRQHIRDLFRESKKLRGYALDDGAVDGLAAYGAARQSDRNENFSQSELRQHFEAELSGYMPSLVRLKPAAKQTLPQTWIDEVTGEKAVNPWAVRRRSHVSKRDFAGRPGAGRMAREDEERRALRGLG